MMKSKSFLALSIIPLFITACHTIETVKLKSPVSVKTTLEKKLNQASRLEKVGNYQKAYIIYCEIQKDCDDINVYRDIQLRLADILLKMRKYPAALSALAPMPELPESLYDCKKLFMAARVLKKMKGKPEHIEALMEVALDNRIDEPGVVPFKADGYAELGRVYVDNKKIPRAIKCFKYAADLYKMDENNKKADACRNILEYLR